jgi:hypothetical protein
MVGASIAALAGCNALLDNGGREAAPVDGGDGVVDDGSVGDATQSDAAQSDVQSDAIHSDATQSDAAQSDASQPDAAVDATQSDAPSDALAEASSDTGSDAPSDAPFVCADASPTQCGASCVDLMTNAQNCGACGHDCLGATCRAGLCDPTVYFGAFDAYTVDVDDNNVYYGSNGQQLVGRCPLTGCNGTPTVLADHVGLVFDIALDANNVYYAATSTNVIGACAIGGCNRMPTTLYGATAYMLAIDATNIYSADQNSLFLWGPKTGGGDAGVSGSFGLGSSLAESIFVDPVTATNVYVLMKSSVKKCTVTLGCNDVPGTSGILWGQTIVSDGTNIYWTDYGTHAAASDGALRSCPVAGCSTPKDLATGLPGPVGLSIDNGQLYFTTYGVTSNYIDGAVMTCPVSGCVGQPRKLAVNQKQCNSVKAHGSYVYWANRGTGAIFTDGSVQRVAK